MAKRKKKGKKDEKYMEEKGESMNPFDKFKKKSKRGRSRSAGRY